MRKIVKEFNVYQIEELTGVNRRNALDAVSRLRAETFSEVYSEELISSMTEAAEKFGFDLHDYSVGLFDRSYVRLDSDEFETYNAAKREELATWVNDNTEPGSDGSCPFTGVCYDCYFFDYFKENGETTADALLADIPRAISYMLRKAVLDEESSIINDDHNEQYAEDSDLWFGTDGEIYYE